MRKFIKIICIGCCFGMFDLRSEEYNVITVSRGTTATSYNRLSEEEIRLVYIQLARCFSKVDISSLAPEGGWSNQAESILEEHIVKVENPNIPTIVVFNEAFFGRDTPLSKEEVDNITNIYKKLPNTYLYINFLYTDTYTKENAKEYTPQIEISKKRYTEIANNEMKKNLETIMQPSFVFSDGIQKCIEEDNLESEVYVGDEKTYLETSKKKTFKFGQPLLFNQTKIFYEGEEIGYYNKSSFWVYATLPRSVKTILKTDDSMTMTLVTIIGSTFQYPRWWLCCPLI